jgi:hypothetical protein
MKLGPGKPEAEVPVWVDILPRPEKVGVWRALGRRQAPASRLASPFSQATSWWTPAPEGPVPQEKRSRWTPAPEGRVPQEKRSSWTLAPEGRVPQEKR